MNEHTPRPRAAAPHALACVSFLNSKPLIEPLLHRPDVAVHFAVPAQLLALLDAGIVSTALLPIVDYQASRHNLLLVPAGAIGCDGPTLTVRIYSKVPPEKITTLHADTDSHTSVILAQVILREPYGIAPPLPVLRPLAAREGDHHGRHESMLLIGDKVINAAPAEADYRWQLDLGEEWKKLTGLPFVFACWMMRADMIDRPLADLLAWAQRRGATMTEQLLDTYAAPAGWPRDLARRYFTEFLRYDVPPAARTGIETFFRLAARHGLLRVHRPLNYLELSPAGTASA